MSWTNRFANFGIQQPSPNLQTPYNLQAPVLRSVSGIDPGNPSAGNIIFDSDTGSLDYGNGTEWQSISSIIGSENVGSGYGLALPIEGELLPFKSLIPGSNVTFGVSGTDITINSSTTSSDIVATVTTTDATPTVISTIPMTNNALSTITVNLNAFDIADSEVAVYFINTFVQTTSGVSTLSTQVDMNKLSTSFFTFYTFSVSGSNLILTVTGSAGMTISWQMVAQVTTTLG